MTDSKDNSKKEVVKKEKVSDSTDTGIGKADTMGLSTSPTIHLFLPGSISFPKFTGAIHEDVATWISMIDQFGKLNKWNDQQLCAVVLSNVSLPIYKFLSTKKLNFEALKEDLVEKYGPYGLTHANKMDSIAKRIQTPVVSCADFGT